MNTRIPAALALSALLALVGCGGTDNDSTPDPTPDPDPMPNPMPTPGGAGGDSGIVEGVIDRMGRPGVSTALIRTDDDEDAYNANGDPSTWAAEFTAPMVERMRLIDSLDGVTGNLVTGSADDLTAILVDDRLQIDTSVPECGVYLALEIGFQGCGGRSLETDVIDDTLRHLVSQDMPVSDLADAVDKALPTDWPFLAEPN